MTHGTASTSWGPDVRAEDVEWLVGGVLVGLLVGVMAARRSRGPWWRRLVVALACAHLGGVLAVTLLPFGAGTVYPGESNISLQPLRTIVQLLDGPESARQLGGNLLLLAPMGLLVPMAWNSARPWARTMGWGLLLSVTIELGQLAENTLGLAYRVIDVDDVLLNVLGVAAGRLVFGLGHGLVRLVTRGRRARR